MKTGLLIILLVSPYLWPIGENPVPGDPYVIVNKRTNRLAFFNENEIKHIYPVATGKSAKWTPEGEFTVVVKAKNPYYRKKEIPGGSEENPLGSRWIGIDARNTDGRIYGIHGNNDPAAIGSHQSAGCVRMYEKDVQQLYRHVPLGTKVLIVSTDRSFKQIAIVHGALNKAGYSGEKRHDQHAE
ncbi:MAG TPA: L,D-transpeptidase [Bacillales bacterium]|nr:L,D-transpeptidase [Bacillales bacterium]